MEATENINQMKVFLAVVETKNLGKAAKNLKMPLKDATHHIAEVERLVGYPLFDRAGSDLKLKKESAKLVPHMKKALKIYEHTAKDQAAYMKAKGKRMS